MGRKPWSGLGTWPWSEATVMTPRLSTTGLTSVNATHVSRKPGRFWASLQGKPSSYSAPAEKDKKRDRAVLSRCFLPRPRQRGSGGHARLCGGAGGMGGVLRAPSRSRQASALKPPLSLTPKSRPWIWNSPLDTPWASNSTWAARVRGLCWPPRGRRDPHRTVPAEEILTVSGPGEL